MTSEDQLARYGRQCFSVAPGHACRLLLGRLAGQQMGWVGGWVKPIAVQYRLSYIFGYILSKYGSVAALGKAGRGMVWHGIA